METWEKIVLTSLLIGIAIFTAVFCYSFLEGFHSGGVSPIIFLNFDWDNSSGFRMEYFNGSQYRVLSRGQTGIVNVTFSSLPWAKEPLSVQLLNMTVGDTFGDPNQYYLPQNVTAAAIPDVFIIPVNGTVTVSLVINASANAEVGTWESFTLDVATGTRHIGPNFKFAITNNG